MPTTQTVLAGLSYTHTHTGFEPFLIIDEGTGEPTEWVPVGAERSYAIVHAWHDDNHFGVFRFCDVQPCHALNRNDL